MCSFFNDTPPTEIYTLSLHDALPIYRARARAGRRGSRAAERRRGVAAPLSRFSLRRGRNSASARSEEHTSELQSLAYLVCRLLLEKKNSVSLATMTLLDHVNPQQYLW